MQFDFLSQGTYTGTLVSPLSFNFGEIRYSFTADQSTYTFAGSYTPGSTFNMGLVPATSIPYPYNVSFNPILKQFEFTNRRERFDVLFTNPNANNAGVFRGDLVFQFQKDFSRGASTEWEYDFTKQSTEELLAKITTFSFITTCEPYVPVSDFKFNWSWYGAPCTDNSISFDGDLVANTTTPVARMTGDVSPFFIANLNTNGTTPITTINAFTPEQHYSVLGSQLSTPVANFKVYTSTLFLVDFATTTGTPTVNVAAFTTEAYESQVAATTPDNTCSISTRTSEEYISLMGTTTPAAKSNIAGYVSPARETVLTANTGDLNGAFDITFNQPTFVQYLNKQFDIRMVDGVQVSSKVCSLAQPFTRLTKHICSSVDIASILNVAVLIPAAEYKWEVTQYRIVYEPAEAITIGMCAKFAPLESLSTDVRSNLQFTNDSIFKKCCLPAFNLNNYDNLSIDTVCASSNTDRDFEAYLESIAGYVNPYVPSTTFNMSVFGPSKTIIMQTSNIYNVGLTRHASLLTSGLCTQTKVTALLDLHVCSDSENAAALPYGRYVPSDPTIDPIDPTPPETGVTITVETKGLYRVINQYSAKLNNGTDISFDSLIIKCDADSYSWSFSGSLSADQDRSIITPATDGQPIELVVIVNSYQWTLLIESISTRRSFGNSQVTVSGRGITALLSDPYYSTTSLVQSGVQTNLQIAESLIPYDWTLDWSIPVWNVPSGTYSHADLTPVVALSRLISDCGGMLVPDRTSKKFYAKKRYPVLPWNFGTVNADIVIPDSAIINLTEEPIGQYGYDGVYVHGTTTDGVVALVRRSGTAGSRLITTESNSMMVDATALHTLGQRLLAAEAPQPTIKQITTFMDGSSVPLVAIGSLLDVVVDDVHTKGVVNGVSITLQLDNDALTVSQTLSIGESTENTFSLLKALVPDTPLVMGKLKSTDGSKSVVDLVNGGSQNVRGTGTVGLNYYIKDDVIQSVAPSVTAISDVIVY